MKAFVASPPDLAPADARPFRSGDDKATLVAIKAVAPPISDAVAAELVAMAVAFPATMSHPLGKDVRKAAKKIVDKHVAGAAKIMAAFKGVGVNTHLLDERVRKLAHPLRIAIAEAMTFHGWNALTVPFEEDAAFRGAILDLAVERAARDEENVVMLGEIYTEWHGSHGSASTLDLHTLPADLADELATRRDKHPFTGVSFHACSLTDLPAELAKAAPWLTHLSLDYNPIETVPEVVFELSNLETLEIAGTQLADISPDIAKLRKLRRLDIGNDSRMKSIPLSVCGLEQLTDLRIGNGTIKAIPDAIAGMKSLEVLEMQSTSITKLPAAMASLPKLRRIEAKFSRLDVEKARAMLPSHVEIEA